MNESRTYRGVQDIASGEIFLIYTVNGTTDTFHISAVCRDAAEAKALLAHVVANTTSAPCSVRQVTTLEAKNWEPD